MELGVYGLVGLSGVLVAAVACFQRNSRLDVARAIRLQLKRSADTIRGEL